MFYKFIIYIFSVHAFAKDPNVEPCNLVGEDHHFEKPEFDYTDPIFYNPIDLTDEEKNMTKINNPVTIEYAVQPEQWLFLMKHD